MMNLHSSTVFQISVLLKDPSVHEALTLGIHTKGIKMKPNSENIGVYQIYYKVMNTIVPNFNIQKPLKKQLCSSHFFFNFNFIPFKFQK